MRNNSLRQQAWQNKQQANIFKKVTQLTPNQSLDQCQPHQLQTNSYKTNYHQHSELKWLEKLMTDMSNFKEDQKPDQVLKQKKVDQTSQAPRESSIKYQTCNATQKKNSSKEVKRRDSKQEELKKSRQKLKFQIICNKENRIPSEKKGLPTTSCKNSDKIKNKSNKKIIAAKQDQHFKDKPIKHKNHSNKEAVEMQKMVTETFPEESFEAKNSQSLWKNNLKEINFQSKDIVESHIKLKKSIGKIVKNSNNETFMEQLTSKQLTVSPKIERYYPNLQKQPQRYKRSNQISKKKPEKVYIKLQTQKLSKYLMQSEVNEVNQQTQKQLSLENQQFTKYCPTKRGEHIVIKAVNCFSNTGSDLKIIDKTQIIQRKKNVQRNMKTNDSFANYQAKQCKLNNNYLSYKKQKGKVTDYLQNPAVPKGRTKSQQRKLNQVSRAILHNESINQSSKPQQPQPIPAFSFKYMESPYKTNKNSQSRASQLKKSNMLQKSEKKRTRVEQIQKIFTLNSDQGQDSEQKQLQLILTNQNQSQTQVNMNSEQKIAQNTDIIPKILLTDIQLNKIKFISKDEQKIEPKQPLSRLITEEFDIENENQNYFDMLKQLFNFLDDGKRNLLTSSNCKADGLTQQLKLLLSPVINQIKSKKKTYNLEKFILEGQQVLKIKQEVYKTSKSHSKKSRISEILKQNIQILIKRAPFDFLHPTHTYSYYETNQNSKRESIKDSHSVVISKLVTQQKNKTHSVAQPAKRVMVRQQRKISQQIDFEQPEFYFQQKYCIKSAQLRYQATPKSNYCQKKIDGFKNLKEDFATNDI